MKMHKVIYFLFVLAVFGLLIFQIAESGFDSLWVQDSFPNTSKGKVGEEITPEAPFELELKSAASRIHSVSILIASDALSEEDRAGVEIRVGEQSETLSFTGSDVTPGEYTILPTSGTLKPQIGDPVSVRIYTERAPIRLGLSNKGKPCVRLIYWGISRGRSILMITGFLCLYLAAVVALSFCKSFRSRFLSILTVTSVAFLIVIPYSQVSDDIYHFAREYEISEGYLISPMTWQEEGKLSPGNLNAGLHYGDPYSVILRKGCNVRLDQENPVQYGYNNTALYSPVPYIPQLIGIFLGRLLTDRVMIIVMLSRIFAMVCGIAMLWAAVRITPVNAQIICAISFIPIFVNEMVSTSADSFVNSFLILYFSWICARIVRDGKPMGVWEKVFAFLCPTLLALCKVVYFPFAFLLLLVPAERFGSRRRKGMILAPSFLIAGVLYAIWSKCTGPFIDQFNNTVDHSAQIHYALTHPVAYVGILLRSLSTFGVDYFWGMLGDSLGWVQNLHINGMFLTGYLIILVLLVTMQREHAVFRDTRFLVLNIGIIVLVSVLTLSALYAHDTEVAAPLVNGMQGRYFLPVLLPAITVCEYIGFRCREVREGGGLRETAGVMLPRYFYLFMGWMEASMMLTVVRELWH